MHDRTEKRNTSLFTIEVFTKVKETKGRLHHHKEMLQGRKYKSYEGGALRFASSVARSTSRASRFALGVARLTSGASESASAPLGPGVRASKS